MNDLIQRKKNFGIKLKRLLKENNMKQIDLARLIDVTDTTMSRYVQGKVKPKPLLLKRIAEVFNCSTKDLF